MKTSSNLLLSILLLFLCAGKTIAQEEPTVPYVQDPNWNKLSSKLYATWNSTDYPVDKFACPSSGGLSKQQSLTAWKGERLHAKLLLWSSREEGEVSFSITEPEGKKWVDRTTTGFLHYVMTDELNKDGKGGCGYRPDKTQYDSSLVADRIQPIETMEYEAKTVRPVWITIDVPHDAVPGLYKGSVEVKSSKSAPQLLTYSIRVIDRTLPEATAQKFHLDLWQNPFAVARLANAPLWSKAHFDAMRPLMERLAKAGQRGITATITHKPWNGQTYDYFENMVTEVRRIDGTWMYDFTVFDRWVEFMQSCGVGPYIYCYSVIPWELNFRYYDQAANAMVDRKLKVSDPGFDDYWVSKLSAFAAHLKTKGWFDHTIIAMDERPMESMNAALHVIRKADKSFKISLAGTYHKELDDEIFDYCIGYNDQYPAGVIDARRAKGKITTFYTCCTEAFPNTFSFSLPMEATAFGPIAEQRGLDGYLRWAYNSWVKSPFEDTRFTAWAGGDTYIVYPESNSSVRFEKLIEGIQLYEKMQQLKADGKRAKEIHKQLQPFAYDRLNRQTLKKSLDTLKAYLNK